MSPGLTRTKPFDGISALEARAFAQSMVVADIALLCNGAQLLYTNVLGTLAKARHCGRVMCEMDTVMTLGANR